MGVSFACLALLLAGCATPPKQKDLTVKNVFGVQNKPTFTDKQDGTKSISFGNGNSIYFYYCIVFTLCF